VREGGGGPHEARLNSRILDHGSEFSSRAFLGWARSRGVALDFIRPGKPVDNAYVESFNGKLRDECPCLL
jgi:transposase InsO family protein